MPNSRVLVLGAGGMLGHKVFQVAVQKYPLVVGTLRQCLGDYPVGGIPEFQSGQVIQGCDAMELFSEIYACVRRM